MTTNITSDDLHYDHTPTNQYDDEIRRVIPGWGVLHQCIEQLCRAQTKNESRVLELGIGTGLTAERVLRVLPSAAYTGIDFSEHMLVGAKTRLRDYNVTYMKGDYAEEELPSNNNLVVSVIGMHHQGSDAAKKKMFGKIYESLMEDGAFIFGDLVTYKDNIDAQSNAALHDQFLKEHATNERALQTWLNHQKHLNVLAPLEDHVQWLRETGFREVSVPFRIFQTALIYAKK